MADIDPDLLLSDAALTAAVGALAARNQHHLADMQPAERDDALAHWRELALDVLTAARATLQAGDDPLALDAEAPGRAVLVLQDAGEEEVEVHVSFHPQLEELGEDEVRGTPAQVTALALLEQLAGGAGEDD